MKGPGRCLERAKSIQVLNVVSRKSAIPKPSCDLNLIADEPIRRSLSLFYPMSVLPYLSLRWGVP